jgi:hypothetical protein
MKKTPQERYASTAEVTDALRPFASDGSQRRGHGSTPVRPLSPSAKAAASTPLPPKSTASPSSNGLPPARQTAPAPPSRTTPAANADVNARLAGLRPNRPHSTATPVPGPEAGTTSPEPASAISSTRTWDQRLGPMGIALIAILAGAAAWLASSFIK